ncbi:MAG TPA: DUF1579 domain-containing protein [Planctomycetota bacterium]|nr:DUF1579 domain-containing protein [Planctomycetota bacterium]
MKPSALALLVAALLSACAETDLEKRADADRAAHNQAMAARAASSTAAMSTVEAKPAAATPVDFEVPPYATAPTEQHAWLQQLVGEWSFTCKATMQEQAFEMTGTESVRPVGGLWIVAEGRSTVAGQPLQSVMSLGYQPEAQAFVGTWFDSSQSHLWSYKGALDDGRRTLTLDTEGPSFDTPGQTSRYRDAIELTDKNHKVLTSSVQQPDGSWRTFMRAEYVRAR